MKLGVDHNPRPLRWIMIQRERKGVTWLFSPGITIPHLQGFRNLVGVVCKATEDDLENLSGLLAKQRIAEPPKALRHRVVTNRDISCY